MDISCGKWSRNVMKGPLGIQPQNWGHLNDHHSHEVLNTKHSQNGIRRKRERERDRELLLLVTFSWPWLHFQLPEPRRCWCPNPIVGLVLSGFNTIPVCQSTFVSSALSPLAVLEGECMSEKSSKTEGKLIQNGVEELGWRIIDFSQDVSFIGCTIDLSVCLLQESSLTGWPLVLKHN